MANFLQYRLVCGTIVLVIGASALLLLFQQLSLESGASALPTSGAIDAAVAQLSEDAFTPTVSGLRPDLHHLSEVLVTRMIPTDSVTLGRLYGTNQSGAESHPGQALAILAQVGVARSTPVFFADDSSACVGDIVDDLVANFVLEGEVFWDVTAIGVYCSTKSNWVNKYGDKFSFDGVARFLMSDPAQKSSCAGTHGLIALTSLLRIDIEHRIWSPEVRSEVRTYLKGTIDKVVHSQHIEGYWDLAWRDRTSIDQPNVTSRGKTELLHRVLATGHHLEWLMICPKHITPDDEVYTPALLWCLPHLEYLTRDSSIIESRFCPLTHAIRACYILTNPCPIEKPQEVPGTNIPPR